MSYAPQPGTIPFRAVEWLRAMGDLYPDREYSTPDICEALDIDTVGFTAYMATVRVHGLVHARFKPGQGKLLFWKIGDGKPVANIRGFATAREKPLSPPPEIDLEAVRAAAFPPPPAPGIRAIEWEGRLLVTGMQIIDGVAVFEHDQVLTLKRKTDWWGAHA